MTPWLPGSALRRSALSSVERDPQQLRGGHEVAGSVEGADQRQECPGRVGEPGNGPGRFVGLLVALGEGGATGAQRDHRLAGGQAEAESAGHVVTGPRGDGDPVGGVADDLVRRGYPGQLELVADRPPDQVLAVRRSRWRRNSRCRRRPHGRWSARSSRPPICQVSQSCGSTTDAVRAALSGSARLSQRILDTVIEPPAPSPPRRPRPGLRPARRSGPRRRRPTGCRSRAARRGRARPDRRE